MDNNQNLQKKANVEKKSRANNDGQNSKGGPGQQQSGNNKKRPPRNKSASRNNFDTKLSQMSLNDWGGEMLKSLECPVCLDPMTENILMCETGHSICQSCSTKLCPPICPVCKSKITLQRNIALEQLAQSMLIPCSNKENGCKYRAYPSKMQQHFEMCHFKMIFCPIGKIFNNCSWHGCKARLMAHVNENHSENAKYSFGKEIQIKNFSIHKGYNDVQLMVNDRGLFLFNMYIDNREKIAYFIVQFVGHEMIAKKWKYTLTIYKKSDHMKKIEISDVCPSDSCNVNDIYSSGDCVGVPLHVLGNYVDKNNLSFKLTTYFYNNNQESSNP